LLVDEARANDRACPLKHFANDGAARVHCLADWRVKA
jgi:hypothetical protein